MSQVSEEPVVEQTTAEQGSWLPNRRVWIIMFVCLVAIISVKLLSDEDALFNLVSIISLGICALSLLVWFRFYSAYDIGRRKMVGRVATLVALVTVGAGFATIAGGNRTVRFSGGLVPEVVENRSLDASLGDGQADLMVTTPDDFPQFLGPDRNSIVNGVGLNSDWQSNPPQRLWEATVGAGWSAFSAVNGYAVTLEQRGTDGELEVVTCYDIETGQPVWSNAYPARHTSVLGFVGPRSTPTLHGGRVYTMGATGVLRCLNGASGEEIWARDLMAERDVSQDEAEQYVAWGRSSSPLVVDDMLVVNVGGSGDNVVTLMAVSLENGETIWEGGDLQIGYSSPQLVELCGIRQIVSVNEDCVTSHDVKTGDTLWTHPWQGHSNSNANCSQPVALNENKLFLSKGYGHGAAVIELDEVDGEWMVESLWFEKVMKTKFSNVAILNGYAYGLDDGILSCVDTETGERMWKKGRYGYGQILMVDSLLLVMSERKGTLSLVEANPDRYNELGKIDVIEGQTWNNLCLYGKKLLIRNSETAVCYELP